MNGSENWYAGAMFFALISLGALLKLDDIIGLAVGAASAIFAAISLRRALAKSALAAEEDHQRMEIQLQQLRSKIMETSTVSVEAMSSVNEAMTSITETTHLLQDNLQVIRVRLAELDNLTPLAKSAEEIQSRIAELDNLTSLAKSAVEINAQLSELNNLTLLVKNSEDINAQLVKNAEEVNAQLSELNNLTPLVKNVEAINEAISSMDENSSALNAELEKIAVALQAQEQAAPELLDELKKLNEAEKTNAENLQTVLKLLQVIGQMMKTPTYSKDFEALKTSSDATHKELSELVKINGELSKNFTTTIEDLTKLNSRRDTTRKTPQIEEPPILNEHDITMLKKIVAKINIK